MRTRTISLIAVALVLLLPSGAQAEPSWAPADQATVHPGVQTFTDGSQCTANFVFFDANDDIYVGQAAHCAGTGGATETNGCDSGSMPLGTTVELDGADAPGTLVYSSWLTMQARSESDENACEYNDFALIKLDPLDYDNVNPSVPFYGGPTAVGAPSSLGDNVYSYGNSGLRFGFSPLSPKEGYSLGQHADGWSHDVYTATPGIPGDSGSAFLSPTGAALGTLSTVAILPFPASNGVGDLARELDYARQFGGFNDLQLALGTEAFVAGVLPAP
ncbi:MAG: serine protease [Actinomycetota bacterium]|nr:serine protease [Actinomycetota bacterium]